MLNISKYKIIFHDISENFPSKKKKLKLEENIKRTRRKFKWMKI